MRRRPDRRTALLAALAWATGASSCVAPRRAPAPDLPARIPGTSPPAESAGAIVHAHNIRRARAGLPPLTVDPMLRAAALDHALDMADRRKMGHQGGDGSSPFDRIEQQGYRFRAAAENVAFGFEEVESVMASWMRSPGHRRNILGNFSEIGAARIPDKSGASYWCVTFGTPR